MTSPQRKYFLVADHDSTVLPSSDNSSHCLPRTHTMAIGDHPAANGGKVITPVDDPPHSIHDVKLNGVDDKTANGTTTKNGEEGKEGKKEEKKKDEPVVGMFQLFRFADGLDILAMIVGLICAMAHGAALPMSMIVFGDMTDLFVNFGKELNLTANQTVGPDLMDLANLQSLQGELMKQMKTFTIFFVILACVVLVVGYAQVAFWQVAATRQGLKIRVAVFRAILRQEIGWFDVHEIGELNTRLTDDTNKVIEGLGDKIGNFFQWFSCFLVGIVIGFVYGWRLALVILAFLPVLAASGTVFMKLTTIFTTKELAAYAKAGAVAEEVFGAVRTVVAFGGQQKEQIRYEGNLGEAKNFGIKKAVISGAMMASVFLIVFAVYAVTFWYGSKLVREDPENYSPGNMLIVFFAVVIGAFSLGNAGPNLTSVGAARGAAYIIFGIIDSIPPIDSASEEGQKPSSISGNLEFRGIHFRYPSRDEVKVLDGLNLQIKPGQTVALVGASGCGKSTTVQLIQRFYDPEAGAILLDGTNIKDLNVNWLRSHIGLVSQEPILFATTIAENIRFGRKDLTQEEMEKACRMANAHDFITALPSKYETLVGERGAQLSGGQKQRIAIARALVSDPKILLLDEATSALDTESEATVQAALDKAREGRTTLIIAHRLSTIKNADVIIGIDQGKEAEFGTHDELMAQGGIYCRLVTNQTQGHDELDEDGNPPSYASLNRTPSHRGKASKARLVSQTSVMSKKAEEEEEEKLPQPAMGRVFKLNSPEACYIVMGCISALIAGSVQPGFALIFAELLKIYTKPPAEQEQEATMYSLLFLAIGVVNGAALLFQSYFFGKAGEELTSRVRVMAFKSIIGQDIAYFDDHRNSVGALTARLSTDAAALQGVTGARLGVICQALSSIGVGLIIGFIYSYKLTFLIMAFVPFIVVGGLLQMKVLQGSNDSTKAALEDANKIATEAIGNMRTVASLTKETKFVEMYQADLDGPFAKVMRSSHLNGLVFSFTQSLMFFAYAASFSFGAWLVDRGELEFQDLFRVFFAIVFSAMAAGQASSFAPDYGKGQEASARLFALFDTVPSINALSEDGNKPSSCNGNIAFEEVNFTYASREEVPVLQGLNLTVEQGKTVALVGPSGCGKSTTVQLIERFYDPRGGKIRIDGSEFSSLNVQWLRAQIGIVSQEPILFDCSIRENIEYGDNSRKVSMDEVIEAARDANIHSFISELPEGYETNCGDKGTQLSGGQKQRLAIARALIRKPKVLLLDEATSALDTESEKVVQEALDRARAGRTCVVIAHRLSTVQNADSIVVIRQGKAVEQGTHKELLALKGFYYGLHNAQLRK